MSSFTNKNLSYNEQEDSICSADFFVLDIPKRISKEKFEEFFTKRYIKKLNKIKNL